MELSLKENKNINININIDLDNKNGNVSFAKKTLLENTLTNMAKPEIFSPIGSNLHEFNHNYLMDNQTSNPISIYANNINITSLPSNYNNNNTNSNTNTYTYTNNNTLITNSITNKTLKRKDVFGNDIDKLKKHTISFIDDLFLNLTQVNGDLVNEVEVENYKEYNTSEYLYPFEPKEQKVLNAKLQKKIKDGHSYKKKQQQKSSDCSCCKNQ